MKFDFNDKTQLPVMGELDKKDIADALAILEMMSMSGWKVYQDYIEMAREAILDAGKDGIRTRAKRDLSSEKWAILKGYDECRWLAEKVKRRFEEFKQSQQPEEEKVYGPTDNEE